MCSVDFNTEHKCKNFDAIREWAKERQLPESVQEDFLQPPQMGDRIFEEIPWESLVLPSNPSCIEVYGREVDVDPGGYYEAMTGNTCHFEPSRSTWSSKWGAKQSRKK